MTPPSKKASADFGDRRVPFDKEGDLKEEDEDEDGDGQVGKWNLLEYSISKISLHSAWPLVLNTNAFGERCKSLERY